MNAAQTQSAVPEGLLDTPFRPLPLAAVRPSGWLQDQLRIQAAGLTGHLDEFWPSVSESMWKGGAGDAWERGPYYLDGLVPLAYVLDDSRLKDKVRTWMEPILASGRANGWFGPEKNKDRWPLAVALKALAQYYEATQDARALRVIDNYLGYLASTPPDWPDKEWRGVRAMENLVTIYWRYRLGGRRDPGLLKIAASVHDNCFDWSRHFREFPNRERTGNATVVFSHFTHVVNNAMAVKYPGLWYQQSRNDADRQGSLDAIAGLDRYHGQVGGRFSGDEHLAGRSPTQGTELCAIVEYMFSLENLLEVLAEPALADRLEMLAYNGLPGACTPDFWAHVYDQQANQVLCSVAKRDWTNNDDTSNIYGLEPNFGCCTANMHQGWPKFVAHMWMGTPDGGLGATAYGPSRVTTKLPDGATVTIDEQTDYPFDGEITLRVSAERPVRFKLSLRIPAWAEGAQVSAAGENIAAQPGTFAAIERTWRPGDEVHISLPMRLRAENRYREAVSILRGPLVFSLQIGERYRKIKSHHDVLPSADWEVEPTTPWNYGLLLDSAAPEKAIRCERRQVTNVPFAQPAVVLKATGRRIPSWGVEHNSAGPTPTPAGLATMPAASAKATEELELIPYGATRLRISEFPVLKG